MTVFFYCPQTIARYLPAALFFLVFDWKPVLPRNLRLLAGHVEHLPNSRDRFHDGKIEADVGSAEYADELRVGINGIVIENRAAAVAGESLEIDEIASFLGKPFAVGKSQLEKFFPGFHGYDPGPSQGPLFGQFKPDIQWKTESQDTYGRVRIQRRQLIGCRIFG